MHTLIRFPIALYYLVREFMNGSEAKQLSHMILTTQLIQIAFILHT